MPEALVRRFLALFAAGLLLPAVGTPSDAGFFPYSLIQTIPSPAGEDSGQPHLAVAPDGTVVLSWLEPAGAGHGLWFATLDAGDWSAPRQVARGDDWFVNWADFPSVVPITDEVWAAHWLAKSADATYAYDVMLSVSRDGGNSWSAPFSPHTDGTPTEHGFVTLFPWQEAIGVVWLDGRNTAGGHGSNGGGMTLRSALVSPEGELLDRRPIDELVCDCCQTDAVVTESGPLVAYRNRNEEEIRDIQVARSDGGTWAEPVAVHEDGWQIAGCPVNGPALATDGRRVDIVWFTAAETAAVRFARSQDGGASFGAPVTISSASDGERAPWGRVDVVTLDDGSSLVSHVAHAGAGQGRLSLHWVSERGEVSSAGTLLSDPEPARQVGFPQMVRDGPDIVLAWTAAEGADTHRVHTVRLSGQR
ncbi:MAG: sialidase family protein [Gammaproteobacteria bacterium]